MFILLCPYCIISCDMCNILYWSFIVFSLLILVTGEDAEDNIALSIRVGERSCWFAHEDNFVGANNNF